MSRQDILDAALQVLAEQGDARPDAIARAAGVSKALVFHHFGNLEGLHDAMAARVLGETQSGLDALASEYPNPRLRLEGLTRALLSAPPESPEEARRIQRFWLSDTRRGGARDSLVADFITKTLREARVTADPREVSEAILMRWHGATTLYANAQPIDHERASARALDELRRMLG